MAFLCTQAFAEGPNSKSTPGFGLVWSSKLEIEAQGVTLTSVEFQQNMEVYSATKLPKSVSDIDAVYLVFDGDSQLVKVLANSKLMTNDYYGNAARNRVNEIVRVIEKKYSIKPRKITHTDKYYSGDDYAYGINNEKNHYFVVFEGTDITVGLKITSPSYGDLAYTIEYEKQPDWREFLDRMKEQESTAF